MEENSMFQTKKRAHAALAAGMLAAGAITLLGGSPATAVAKSTTCGDEHAAARPLPGGHAKERNELSDADATRMNADLRQKVAAKAKNRIDLSAEAAGGTIPVVFHVVTGSGGVGNLTDATIKKQIEALN